MFTPSINCLSVGNINLEASLPEPEGHGVIPLCVCAVLSAATFVGGGFIVGLTEAVYTPTMGLAWAVMPLTAALSFIVGKSFNNNTITCIISAFAHDFPFSDESGSCVRKVLHYRL